MTPEYQPTARRVVAGWLLVGLLAVAGLVAMTEWLSLDHPAAGPVTPEVAGAPDPLRDDVECDAPAPREGVDRQEVVAGPALPVEVTSNQLYDCPTVWDGRRVLYRGEIVGGLLGRARGTWTQINDDVYADSIGPLPTHRDFRGGNAGVGAFIPAGTTDAVLQIGGSKQRGDLVEVVATFRRVHEPTGEVAILEVEQLDVLRRGTPFAQPPADQRRWIALLAALMAVGVTVTERRRRDR